MTDLRSRLASLPIDKGPLRRAGLLSLLLVGLLVAGKAVGSPGPSAAETLPERNEGEAVAETSSARSGWTGGRVMALMLLALGGAGAFVLHRRSPAARTTTDAALDVIETKPLGPGRSLQLVGCGDEVLLLSVGAEGATLLRHWPRVQFEGSEDAPTFQFADALASAQADLPDTTTEAEPTPPASVTAPTEPVIAEPAPEPVSHPSPPVPAAALPVRSWGLHQFAADA